MFFFKKNHFKIIFIIIILTSCKLQEPNKPHGIVFLENRAKKMIVNKTNKNDVIRIAGNPHIKDDNNENNWIYIERVLSKGKYHHLGRHKLKDNNVLVLNFDKYGVLKDKKILKKEDINKIDFSENTTENELSEKSFVQTFLQSIKQKMYSNRSSKF